MKRNLVLSTLLAFLFSIGATVNADAARRCSCAPQRKAHRTAHVYHRTARVYHKPAYVHYRSSRVYYAPPPPVRVVVVERGYGRRHPGFYGDRYYSRRGYYGHSPMYRHHYGPMHRSGYYSYGPSYGRHHRW